MKKTGTLIIIAAMKILGLLPFSILYFFSDLTYYLVYFVAGYRKKVVYTNLTNSFPEKTETEIRAIAKKYYRHLCDLIFETIKQRDMKKEVFDKRMMVKGEDVLNSYFEKGRSIILLATHYGNWEWLAILPTHLKFLTLPVFKPLQDETFDNFLNKNRAKFGAKVISMAISLRTVIESENNKTLIALGLAADQTPPWNHKFWTHFFNQEAMFFNGPAKIAQRFNYPVFFQYTRKLARGKYETGFELLFENPGETDETTIIKTYVARLESLIREKPEYYLWSHKRWKHKRPYDLPIY